jgi:hypothetical protein
VNFKELLGGGKDRREHNTAAPSGRAHTTATTRTVAVIQNDLARARVDAQALTEQIELAKAEYDDAQRIYDARLSVYTFEEDESEPDHSALAAAESRADSLERLERSKRYDIDYLTQELAEAQKVEATETGRAAISALVADAEVKLAAFEQLATEAIWAEGQLFAALFSEGSGMKQNFITGELNTQARTARLTIRDRAVAFARKLGYQIHPDYLADGNVNMAHGRRVEFADFDHHDAQRKQKISAALSAAGIADQNRDAERAQEPTGDFRKWQETGRLVR